MTALQEILYVEGTEKVLISAVKRLGNPISILLLNSPCSLFQVPGIDGCIGYHVVGTCAVVVGDPICSPINSPKLTLAFHAYCDAQNLSIVYFLASDTFAHWAIDNTCSHLLQIGSELSIDPTTFEKKRKLRWKINQSQKHGVVIKQHQMRDSETEAQIKNTMKEWVDAKHGFQVYLGTLDLYTNYPDKRVFYAVQEEKIVGVIVLLRLDRFKGWAITSFLALHDASAGISEMLMSHVSDILAGERCRFLFLGFIGGTKIEKIVGLNAVSRFFAQACFRISRWIFRLDQKGVYLKKYHPQLTPTYILCNKKLGLEELMAIKNTLKVKLCL